MNYATNIALVDKKTNTVFNIIWGMVYQIDEFSNVDTEAVQIDNLPVGVGDTYDGTEFYRDGERVKNLAERQKEDLEALQNQLIDAKAALKLLGVSEEEPE